MNHLDSLLMRDSSFTLHTIDTRNNVGGKCNSGNECKQIRQNTKNIDNHITEPYSSFCAPARMSFLQHLLDEISAESYPALSGHGNQFSHII